MLDNRLIEADATKLDELREMLKAQENSDKLCGIGMKEIHIEHGAAKKVCQAVKSLTDGKKVLMVTGPTEIVDVDGKTLRKRSSHILTRSMMLSGWSSASRTA